MASDGTGVRLAGEIDGPLRLEHDPGASAALVAVLASGQQPPEPFGVQRLAAVPAVAGERPVVVDQTNESVVVGERLVVKWLPRPERRPHPAPPVLAHLAAVGFAATARPYATVSARVPGGVDVLLAMVVDYLPEAADGWDWCVHDLLAALSGDPDAESRAAAFPAELGQLTAALHAAFATPSAVFPEPLANAAPAQRRDWAGRAETALAEALTETEGAGDGSGEGWGASADDSGASGEPSPSLDPRVGLAADRRWLAANADRLRAGLAPLRALAEVSTPVLPIHGDLHVGQVLRWRGGYAIVDFDGNPTVPPPSASTAAPDTDHREQPPPTPVRREPAARDVAQMLTSLDHVGRIADRRTGPAHRARIAAWIRSAAERFLAGYRSTLAERGRADLLDERLLGPFMIEQECRELLYAARFLPRWRYAPMGTLRAMFPAEPDSPTRSTGAS